MDFVTEFEKLLLQEPRRNLFSFEGAMNSEYSCYCNDCKNFYMSFGCGWGESVLYSYWIYHCSFCTDCHFCFESELLYECLHCKKCYNCNFCQDCENCNDCDWSYDLKGCRNCFGCVSLRHKEYYIFNTAYTKEEYERNIRELRRQPQHMIEQKLEKIKRRSPRRNLVLNQCENSFGDYLDHCKNSYYCFDCNGNEDALYAFQGYECKDASDIFCSLAELSYEIIGGGWVYNSNFCFFCAHIYDCEFCFDCSDCKNCFGCINLRQKEFYILNQPYTKEEYFRKVAEIKATLKKTGKYTLDLLTAGLTN